MFEKLNPDLMFLSHLCGGEHANIQDDNRYTFLSHLCGGELIRLRIRTVIDFLSHLCGGEQVGRL
ncbi:hypothetical protein BSPWISOX_1654 [uncultured Gammaproteobacteria bacterium]|nr:hypothetical protein BSPWISOX_1654 [uncultured Gammaproteobacteria bacterium]